MRDAVSRAGIPGIALSMCLLAAGCDPVPEDRTIGFSASGDRVAFQHGGDGVFLANPQTGELERVLEPDPQVIAVSTPLWSSDETRVIFTAARQDRPKSPENPGETHRSRARAGERPEQAAWSDAPEGRPFFGEPIVYTCWLVSRSAGDRFGKPTALFEARTNHAGFVAANLALRWHPTQKKILYLDADSSGLSHAAWSFDLETKARERIFPRDQQPAPFYLLADFTPDGTRLVCVTADPRTESAIWIMQPDGSGAWRLAQPNDAASAADLHGLSALISGRPICAADGQTIAFLRSKTSSQNRERLTKVLRCRLADRKVETVFESKDALSDLQWSRDGSRLGFVQAGAAPTLVIVDARGHAEKAGGGYVRHFAGWSAAGDKLAYVAAATEPPKAPATWALLIVPDPLARDALVIADGRGGGSRTLVSGFRFTFPRWSPRRDEISMWGTFSPAYRSILSVWTEMLGSTGLGLRRGDPAAVIETAGGPIRWMAINADEQSQIGTYFLLKRDYARARDWYGKADRQFPKLVSLRPEELSGDVSRAAANRRTFELFYWYCLTRLGDSKGAAARLEAFERAHRIEWPPSTHPATPPAAGGPAANPAGTDWSTAAARREAETHVAILKDLSAAEVLLSVGTLDEAEAFFNREAASTNRAGRIGALVALTQIELLRGCNLEFASLVTDRLAPLLIQEMEDRPRDWADAVAGDRQAMRNLTTNLLGHAVGPLFCSAFLKQFSEKEIETFVVKWKSLREGCQSPAALLGLDLMLEAASLRLSRNTEREAAANRVAKNSAGLRILPKNGVEPYLAEIRKLGMVREGTGEAR